MIDYSKIWESINKDSENNQQQLQIARRIPTNGLFDIFLATDCVRRIRLLYIRLNKDIEICIDNLPKFRGLEIYLSFCSIGEFINQEFIIFAQSIPKTENIFELVISDICESVVYLKIKENLSSVLTKVLNEWKMFFDKQENEILSISAQKGLVGELHFLRDYLFKKYSFTESLLFWTGSDRTNHDFQIMCNAVEVKTTSSKQHKKFVIASEKQLDSTGLEHLYLILFSLNLHSNLYDRTLPALIKDIYSILHNEPYAKFLFQVKLFKYGYNDINEEKYLIGFSIFDIKFFEVIDGFPRLLQINMPDGIGDLKYSVMVSACATFEFKTNILNKI